MKKILYIIIYALLVAGCCKDDEHLPPMQPDEGALAVALQLNMPGVSTEDVNLYVFDASDRLCYRKYFANAKALASELLILKQETHNIVAVLNCGEELMPPSVRATMQPDIPFAACVEWLKAIETDYPKMLTGWAMYTVQPGGNAVTLRVENGTQGIRVGTIRCTLHLPSPTLPDYAPTRASAPYQYRVVAEAYHKGTNQLSGRQVKILSDNRTFDMTLGAGNYDIRLWGDYVPVGSQSDYYYNTTDTKAVTLADTKNYTAGSDAKDAFYHTFSVDLGNETQPHKVEMIRPFAKYRLVATDVERYRSLVANNGYPPLAEAVITVHYQGYFPSSFNVVSGVPNNSATGVKFVATPGEATGQTVELASDYVLVNGTESAVTVTIVLADRNGKEYGRATGVQIAYRRGYLTTVSGGFLTAGKTGGGIIVDTEWDGEYNVEF